jgi:hypothetical protein
MSIIMRVAKARKSVGPLNAMANILCILKMMSWLDNYY